MPLGEPVVAREKFYQINGVRIFDLQLDSHNPRIRHGVDQHDCRARIVKERDTFMRLLRDIAQNGLSPQPILVSPNEEGKLVVRDGNRRVTALMLLNRPELCLPDEGLRNMVQRIASEAASPVVNSIDCLACDDEATVFEYIRRLHTGENAGVGQVDWSALLISLFNAYSGVNDQNRRAAQLILWMEGEGMATPNDFPITTLTRILNAEALALLGFGIENDELNPILAPSASYALGLRVINDVATKAVNVAREGGKGSIYAPDDAAAYIRRVREEVGPREPKGVPDSPVDSPAAGSSDGPSNGPATGAPGGAPGGGAGGAGPAAAGPDADDGAGGGAPDGGAGGANPSGGGAAGGKPTGGATVKASWDRPRLFGRRKNANPGFSVPVERTKMMTILAELRELDPNETPLAVTMLLRALLELSDKAYRGTHEIRDRGALHKDIAASADHMLAGNLLSPEQHSVIESYTRSEQNMLHVKSIQKYIHDDTYHPHGQALNTIWDEIGCFVKACWS